MEKVMCDECWEISLKPTTFMFGVFDCTEWNKIFPQKCSKTWKSFEEIEKISKSLTIEENFSANFRPSRNHSIFPLGITQWPNLFGLKIFYHCSSVSFFCRIFRLTWYLFKFELHMQKKSCGQLLLNVNIKSERNFFVYFLNLKLQSSRFTRVRRNVFVCWLV